MIISYFLSFCFSLNQRTTNSAMKSMTQPQELNLDIVNQDKATELKVHTTYSYPTEESKLLTTRQTMRDTNRRYDTKEVVTPVQVVKVVLEVWEEEMLED